jgi:hypothetical protein
MVVNVLHAGVHVSQLQIQGFYTCNVFGLLATQMSAIKRDKIR